MKRDLYYKNIPYKNGRVSYLDDFFTELMLPDNSFLNSIQTPFFIITESGYIKELDSFVIDESGLDIIRFEGISIFLDESLSMYAIPGTYNRGFYNEFRHDIDISILKSEELESILNFQKRYDIPKVTVYTQDYKVGMYKSNYPTLDLKCLDIKIRWQIARKLEYKIIDKPITKKFWSGNWRYMPSRHIIMSYINQYSGNYSWHIKASKNLLKQIDWFNFELEDPKIIKILEGSSFLENNFFSLDKSKDLIIEYDDLTVDSNLLPGARSPNTMFPPFETYAECFCAIVTESRYAQPTGFLSEKTFAAIGNLRPFILVAAPGTLEYLKSLGFKTFDRWWDESYDRIENHQDRIFKILDIIDDLNKLSITELISIYEEMKDVLFYNKTMISKVPFIDKPLN